MLRKRSLTILLIVLLLLFLLTLVSMVGLYLMTQTTSTEGFFTGIFGGQ